ncbi:MAG: phage major capsid protein [Luteitalea sp.]|nr:phage major capsid protein [Luteitalea sp.]
MPFTVAELENAAQAAIDFHFKKGKIVKQTIQDRPLFDKLMGKEKSFPGALENMTVRVKGIYTTDIQGFEHDDDVSYGNPANIKTAVYPWKLVHWGIKVTKHELLKNGISISPGEQSTTAHEGEMIRLANLLDDKVEDMQEGGERGMNNMFWEDGSQDAKEVPGLTSFVLDDPTSAVTVGGIDQVANDWWRNRAALALTATTAADQNVVQTLQREFRQLRRFGGRPDVLLAGSDFMDWFEQELRAKGNYTLDGWANKGSIDASVADIAFKGKPIMYDPTLDDMSKSKYLYALDSRHIYPMAIEGESMQDHKPARPAEKYVMYRAKTWVGGLVCDQRNCHGVYSIA